MSQSGSSSGWGIGAGDLLDESTFVDQVLDVLPSKEDALSIAFACVYMSALGLVPMAAAKAITLFQQAQMKKNAGKVAKRRGDEAEIWELAAGEPWDPNQPVEEEVPRAADVEVEVETTNPLGLKREMTVGDDV